MNLKSLLLIVLPAALATSFAAANEAALPNSSASELAVVVTMLRFRIYADRCSTEVPELKPPFERLMENLEGRVQGISKTLTASEEFKDTKDMPVPAEIADALEESFEDGRHNLERRDAGAICPKALQDFGGMNEESLKAALSANLAAIRNMTRKLGKASAREASPGKSQQESP